ncbi:MAG: hypothetical protein JJT81_19645 [Rubellimicrobium sp.]|nr:hypothetical protein [Rubellimicrobium sp.]
MPHRRTLKDPYDINRPVSDDTLAAIAASVMHGSGVGVTNDEARVTALRRLTREALVVEIETPVTYRESVDLFRIGRAEVDANPDGIDFSGPLFESMRLAGLMTREKVLDPDSIAYREGVRAVLDNADTAMGFVWQTTPGNTRAEQIRAGQDWVRLNLAATALGVGVQPMSQPLQEYPEMGDLYRQAHQTLAPGGDTVQMLARLGYGRMPGPSPRWPLGSRVIG